MVGYGPPHLGKSATMKSAKVAIVITSFDGGGAEKSMSILAEALANENLEVALVAINRGYEPLASYPVENYAIGRKWRGSWLNLVISIIKFNITMERLRPDVILANCELSEFMVAFSRARRNIIVVDHSLATWHKNPRLGKVIGFLLKSRTVAIVRVSAQVPLRSSWCPTDIVIKNPVLTPKVRKPFAISKVSRLIFVGRLAPEKNPFEFFEIVKSLENSVLVIGDGPLRKDLEISNPSSEFVGHQVDPWAHVQENDILLFTSLSEGDGLAALEAMCAGLPILLRDTPHYRKFDLPDRFYYGSISDARQKLSDFLNMKLDLKTPSGIAESVASQRSAAAIAREWRELFLSLCLVNELE